MEKNCQKCYHCDACMDVDTNNTMESFEHAIICEHYIPSEFVKVSIPDGLWKEAFNYMNAVISEYAAIGPSGMFAMNCVLLPLKKRYDEGERTYDLYEKIMALE